MTPTSTFAAPAPRSARRPILVLVDVEPDQRKTRTGEDPWAGTRFALGLLAELRAALAGATGRPAAINWFLRLDPQVRETWGSAERIADACPELFRAIDEHGDPCGIHPHFWRFDRRRREWFNDFGDPHWIAECLEVSIAAYERLFGRPPALCRCGDRWLDDGVVARLRAAGVRFDLTVEPGLPDAALHDDPHATGRLPDYRRAPRAPWQPSAADYLVPRAGEPDPDGLWMIPLSTSNPVWRLVRRPPYWMRASRSPNLVLDSGRTWPFLARELSRSTRVPFVLALRSGDLAAPRFAAEARRTAAALARHPALAECQAVDPERALAAFLGS